MLPTKINKIHGGQKIVNINVVRGIRYNVNFSKEVKTKVVENRKLGDTSHSVNISERK